MKVIMRGLAEVFVLHFFPKGKNGEWDAFISCCLFSALGCAIAFPILKDSWFVWYGMGSLFVAYSLQLRKP
jgi:hypothetical protein